MDDEDPRTMDDEDPRVTDAYVRQLSGGDGVGDVVLVGVVHDHPASEYRVKTTVEGVDPDVLALELPPLAVPLFERYAEDGRTPPAFGGEMSAAIQATATDRVVGVDGPTSGFLVRLGRNLYRDDASPATVRRVLGSVASVTKRAVVCRLAAALAARTAIRLEVDSPIAHGCDRSDDPREQAADERTQIRQAKAVANALEPPDSARFRETTREEHMASRLARLRRDGDVVAVVGMDHLDPVTELLGEPKEAP